MKSIPLTQGQFALVDDEDFGYLNQFKWQAHKDGNTFYARTTVLTNGKRKFWLMHRVIMKLSDSKIEVDHKDRNGLNNLKGNLRVCTKKQNGCNKTSAKGSTSKYLGVYLAKVTSKGVDYFYWRAGIKKDGKNTTIGSFKTEDDAAKAYDKKAIELFGEFANLNFKQEIHLSCVQL